MNIYLCTSFILILHTSFHTSSHSDFSERTDLTNNVDPGPIYSGHIVLQRCEDAPKKPSINNETRGSIEWKKNYFSNRFDDGNKYDDWPRAVFLPFLPEESTMRSPKALKSNFSPLYPCLFRATAIQYTVITTFHEWKKKRIFGIGWNGLGGERRLRDIVCVIMSGFFYTGNSHFSAASLFPEPLSMFWKKKWIIAMNIRFDCRCY